MVKMDLLVTQVFLVRKDLQDLTDNRVQSETKERRVNQERPCLETKEQRVNQE